MTKQRPGQFPQEFGTILSEVSPEALEAAKAADEALDEEEAERQGRKTARFAKAKELNKQEKTAKQQKATGLKDQIGDLKTQLGDLGLDLREKTISPQEYKEKADTLVDAIAAAIQDLAQVPGENVKTVRRDIDAAQRTVRSTFDHGVEAVKRATDKAVREAKTKAAHDAKYNTPEASEHRALAAERNEEMGMARDVQAARADAGDRMAAQMGPQELQQVVAQVGKNRLMNSSLGFTLAQQVDFYMGQLEAKMVADFTRGMGQHDRSGQNTNPRGGH